MPAARLAVSMIVSVIFLVIQIEHKPYATEEHNILAELAGAQITATLFFISVQSVWFIPQFFGFLCIVLNVVLIPIAIYFNMRRLKRRKDILSAFLNHHEMDRKDVNSVPTFSMVGEVWKESRHATPGRVEFFDPSFFSEYWKAGHRSEFEVFCATLKWIDAALERPVSSERWGQLLFTLEQLPLTSSENADVRNGEFHLRNA